MAQQTQIGSHKTGVFTEDSYTKVAYHGTVVVKFNHKCITLNNGGWQTVTTKVRMNQVACQFDLGYKVYQKDFDWFVSYKNLDKIPFFNGMRLDRNVLKEWNE